MTKRYVHGNGIDNPLVEYHGSTISSANRYYLHSDHQGSITGISNSAGTVTALNTYDSFGIPHQTNQGRFSYTGQIYLPELEMYHYKARVYHPKLGRFLQTDPVGYEDQMNIYAYVHNDPMSYTDPSGMAGQNVMPTYLQGMSISQINQALAEEKAKPKNQQNKQKIKDLQKAQKALGQRNQQKRANNTKTPPKTVKGGGKGGPLILLGTLLFDYLVGSSEAEAEQQGSVTITELPSESDSENNQNNDESNTSDNDSQCRKNDKKDC